VLQRLSVGNRLCSVWPDIGADQDSVKPEFGAGQAAGASGYPYQGQEPWQPERRSPDRQELVPRAHRAELERSRRWMISEVVVPSDMMAIGDCFEANFLLRRSSIEFFESCGNVLTRHQGKANVVFCDGHVESPTLNFLFEDTSDTALVRWNRDHQPHRAKR